MDNIQNKELIIPEIQRLKEKFPQYKDLPDVGLLNVLVKKHPVYRPLAKRVADEIISGRESQLQEERDQRLGGDLKAGKPTVHDAIRNLNEKLNFGDLYLKTEGSPVKDFARGIFEEGTRTITLQRPYGATRALVAGKSPIEGFKNPDEQQSFGESVASAWRLDLNNPYHLATAAIIQGLTEFGTAHLLFGVPSTVKNEVVQLYRGKQKDALGELHSVVTDELVKVGVPRKQAEAEAAAYVTNQVETNGFFRNTPAAIKQTTAILKANPGKIAGNVNAYVALARMNAAKQGISEKALADMRTATQDLAISLAPDRPPVLPKPSSFYDLQLPSPTSNSPSGLVTPIVLKSGEQINLPYPLQTTEPQTQFGKMIRDQIISKDQIPLHPASEGRLAVANLLGTQGKLSTPSSPLSSKVEPKVKPSKTTAAQPTTGGKPPTEGGGTVDKGGAVGKNQGGGGKPPLEVSPVLTESVAPVKQEELAQAPNIADEVLQRQANQELEVIQQAKQIQSEPSPEVVTPQPTLPGKDINPYSPDLDYEITYKDATGIHTTFGNGEKLKKLEDLGQVIKTFKFSGEDGALKLDIFDDFLVNMHGEVEKKTRDFKEIAKQFGTPFYIGIKYPPFGKVYTAIQDAVDLNHELFYDGAALLKHKVHLTLPPPNKQRVVDVAIVGNSASVQKYFSPQELITNYNLSPKEIDAYQSLVKTYQYATNLLIEARKIELNYYGMDTIQRAKADEQIKEQIVKYGGYLSHSRLKGDWVVYQPPLNANEPARFYDHYATKAEAMRKAKELGADAKYYLKTKKDEDVYKHLTLTDLENLARDADVDTDHEMFKALTDEIKRRGFSSHWIQRRWIPREKETLESLMDNALDYLMGATFRYTKAVGLKNANKALLDNKHLMTPDLFRYAEKFLRGYGNVGQIGFDALAKMVYIWKLSFDESFLAQGLTQPISTTWPISSKYLNGLETERYFIDAYKKAISYCMHKLDGRGHGLSAVEFRVMDKLYKQGVLGNQLTRFQLGVKDVSEENFSKIIGLYGRANEGASRIHAALMGCKIAIEKNGLTDFDSILAFTKNFVYQSNPPFGKHNLPTLITGAGNLKSLARLAYVLRGYQLSYLQMLASMMPNRGAKASQTLRMFLGLTGQAGLLGLPFAGVAAHGWKQMTGHTLEGDMRETMYEADIPDKAIDLVTHGVYSLGGVDTTRLLGVGDVIDPESSLTDIVGGVPMSIIKQGERAMFFAQRGEYLRAFETASPDFIRNKLKAVRFVKEGVRDATGDLLLKPSEYDLVIQGLGFTPLSLSKMYSAEEEKKTRLDARRKKIARYHQRLSEAITNGKGAEVRKILLEVAEYNKKHGNDIITLNKDTVKRGIIERTTGRMYPASMRARFKDIDKYFGVK